MEELLYMILRGIVIGVVVSAPMGPVGIFCIQRTLDKGRLSGLFTGIGAAISDLIYCLLTGFGLSFIEEFINAHRYPIQFLGSLVLVAFGIWLIRKKPDGRLEADPDHENPSREGDILKGFALTFSNPLILFLIIGLFAQFNFVIEGIKFYHYLLGFLGIIAGALGWWWVVTFFVDKLRGHFNQRTMKLINMSVGVIILIFAAVGIFSSAATLIAAPVQPSSLSGDRVSAEFRVADPSKKGWAVEFADSIGAGFRLEVSHVSQPDPFGDSPIDALSLRAVSLPSGEELEHATVSQGIDPYRGANAWSFSGSGGVWMVFAGNREYRHMMTLHAPSRGVSAPKITGMAEEGVQVSAFNVHLPSEVSVPSISSDIISRLESESGEGKKTGISGIYSLFDYEHDDSYARIGGNYRIGIVESDEEGCFSIVYLGGAVIYPDFWEKGMEKGRLVATPFANVFDAVWVDAEGDMMLHDIQADFDPLVQTLTLKFPYQNSLMRFRKE